MMAINGASAALNMSDIPFNGPIGAVRIGRVEGAFIINPTLLEDSYSDLNLIVVGSRKGIVMVEGGADRVPEQVVVDAIYRAYKKF